MLNRILFNSVMIFLLLSCAVLTPLFGQNKDATVSPKKVDDLQGDYGAYRANNALL